jgi:hypothetical protein
VTTSTRFEAEAAREYAQALFRRMLLGWVQDVSALRHAGLDRPCRRDGTPALEIREAA